MQSMNDKKEDALSAQTANPAAAEQGGIAVAGCLILDKHFAISSYPEEGRLTHAQPTVADVGGTGNLIIDLAKIDSGLKVAVSTVLGTGDAGKTVMSRLSQYPNIDTSGIVREGSTSVTLVMDAEDTRQRTFFYVPAASDIYCEKYINWDALNVSIFQLEYLLLLKACDAPDSEYGTHAARILADAQRRVMLTSIDMVSEHSERARDIVRAALKYTDYCTINELEAETVTGIPLQKNGVIEEKNMRQALDAIASLGVSRWVVIHAMEGSFGLDVPTGEYAALPNLPLPDGYIKGKTGAGDAFCCGVLYSAYRGRTINDALKLGTACASCSLSEVNGTDGMRSAREAMALYEKYAAARG